MTLKGCTILFRNFTNQGISPKPASFVLIKIVNMKTILLIFMLFLFTGCVSDKVGDESIVTSYQQSLADQGPQQRVDTEGQDLENPLAILKPTPEKPLTELEVVKDTVSGKEVVNLTIEQAIVRALAESPEIRVVSFDPSIAKQEITKAAAEFDPSAFGRLNFEQEDNPINSIYQPGQSDVRLSELGIKQKGTLGSEWSLSYMLTRSWDDLAGRTLSTRYEPILAFQIRQPLLRDAWQEVNLAGVNIAKLNHEIALLSFRKKAEDISTDVISAYWLLLQARRDIEIQQALLDRTLETLKKVQGRKEIDATAVQIKQAESYVKVRESALLQAKKSLSDAQDALIRLLADPQMTVLSNCEIIPVTEPALMAEKFEQSEILALAMQKHPVVQQAHVAIAIADINISVGKNQKMPRLDLIASARMQGLARGYGDAHNELNTADYTSYGVGISLELPIRNRQRKAELLRRKIERRKAVATLQNLADQLAIQAKERIRKVETTHAQIQVEKDAMQASNIHLQALEDTEAIRERLTPEFLLVKLQAQESLALAQRSEIKAIVDFNISLTQLAQTSGTVLELHRVRNALPVITSRNDLPDQTNDSTQ